jgi:hypothetical protein
LPGGGELLPAAAAAVVRSGSLQDPPAASLR